MPWPTQYLHLKVKAVEVEGLKNIKIRVPDKNAVDMLNAIGPAAVMIPWAEDSGAGFGPSPFLPLPKRTIESTFLPPLGLKMLVLRGVHSDLLSFDLAAEMRKRNRMANASWFDNCGRVPPLMAPEQIDVVSRFLA